MNDPAIGMWVRSEGAYWGLNDDRRHTAVVTGFSYDAPAEVTEQLQVHSIPRRYPSLVYLKSTERDKSQKWSYGAFWTMWKQVGRKAPKNPSQSVPLWLVRDRLLTVPEPLVIPKSRRAFDVKENTTLGIYEVRQAWAMLVTEGKFFGLFRVNELKAWFIPQLNRFERELAL